MWTNLFQSRHFPKGAGRRPRQSSRPLVLEVLESRWCPTLMLTQAGIDEGLNLSNFAYNVPTQDGSTGTIGAYALAFPSNGTVLGSDEPGNVRVYPCDCDGQDALLYANTGQNYGYANAKGLAQLGDNIYMVGYFSASVSQLKTDGKLDHVIVQDFNKLYSAEDVVADPTSGHLYVSTAERGLWDVDPNTGEMSRITPRGFFGISLSADGTTLYAGSLDGQVFGFDTTTYAQVFYATNPMWQLGKALSVAQGTGAFAGNLYVNLFYGGQFWEVNIADPTQQQQIAYGGPPTGGAFITVDPNDGSLLIGEVDRVERLTFPAGAGPRGGPSHSAWLGQEHLAAALALADSPWSYAPTNELPAQQAVDQNTTTLREQIAQAGSTADSQPGFTGRYALDSLFAAHHKDGQYIDPEDLGAFALGFTSALN
jgi:hypothetical protein